MAMKHFQENQPNEGGRGEGEKEGRFPGMVSAEDETEGK